MTRDEYVRKATERLRDLMPPDVRRHLDAKEREATRAEADAAKARAWERIGDAR